MAPTTYTPPINTYVPLESIVLTNAASSVTFFNIAQSDANGTYKDLILIVNPKATSVIDNMKLTFNGDTTSSYSHVYMRGNGSATSSATGTNTALYLDFLPSGVEADFGQIYKIQIQDYSATDKHKSLLVRYDDASQNVGAIAGRWANTSAISLISLFIPSTTFAAGSTFSLYGIHG